MPVHKNPGMEKVSIFWFRRDLRIEDNHGLSKALESDYPVLPLFIFDKNILDALENEKDARVQFIHHEIKALKKRFEAKNSAFLVRYGAPLAVWEEILEEYPVAEIYTNRDYEPYGRQRDKALYEIAQKRDIPFRGYKDQVIFDKNEVLKDDGAPYIVYTPYMKRYKQLLQDQHLAAHPSEEHLDRLVQAEPLALPSLEEMGFTAFSFEYPDREVSDAILKDYHKKRDLPAVQGTSRLSLHLRFGTISIRGLARRARAISPKFFNELIWRDFYQAILYHFPDSMENSFRREYDEIEWENNEEHFAAWCAGKTGYPLVDAGMRELNTTGYMHNRVRMVVASFLTKHLLIDWRWGERYFARKLLDYEAASNVGGWQWAAGSGVDAAPYFRIFNPTRQIERFDPELRYVRHWLPEYDTAAYPEPIVEHKAARERALERYKKALK